MALQRNTYACVKGSFGSNRVSSFKKQNFRKLKQQIVQKWYAVYRKKAEIDYTKRSEQSGLR